MKRTPTKPALGRLLPVAVLVAATAGCGSSGGIGGGWTNVVDPAQGLSDFDRAGLAANWSMVGGVVQATQGGPEPSYLVTKRSYVNFTMRVEFWASPDADSGVFFRCQNREWITDENCYEANIFDRNPDPSYGTGALSKVAPVTLPAPRAGGRWNTYEITARGPRITVVLNGRRTVDIEDARLTQGVIALQWGQGTIRFRSLEIRPL